MEVSKVLPITFEPMLIKYRRKQGEPASLVWAAPDTEPSHAPCLEDAVCFLDLVLVVTYKMDGKVGYVGVKLSRLEVEVLIVVLDSEEFEIFGA